MQTERLIQSFGRKRARGLSELQKSNVDQLAEKFGISCPDEKINPKSLFDENINKVFVEVGFGRGEHLIQNAILNKNVGFIGCEPFENGVANAYGCIKENDLTNVRIFQGDARLLINQFEENSVDRWYVLFPDPWPKKRHHKRRILSVEFMKLLRSKTKVGGELVVATDIEDYMLSILENLQELGLCKGIVPADLTNKPDWFLNTRYEQKALSQNRACHYLKLTLN